MRVRQAQPISFPPGVQTIALPQRQTSWRVVGLAVTWATSAVAGSRWMVLNLQDGAGNFINTWTGAAFAANASVTTNFTPVGFNANPAGFHEIAGIPDDLWVQTNWRIAASISNAQAGDSLTTVNLTLEWFNPKATKLDSSVVQIND